MFLYDEKLEEKIKGALKYDAVFGDDIAFYVEFPLVEQANILVTAPKGKDFMIFYNIDGKQIKRKNINFLYENYPYFDFEFIKIDKIECSQFLRENNSHKDLDKLVKLISGSIRHFTDTMTLLKSSRRA